MLSGHPVRGEENLGRCPSLRVIKDTSRLLSRGREAERGTDATSDPPPLPLSAQFMAPLSGWAKKDMTKRLQDEPLRISYSTRLNLMNFLFILS